MIKEFYGLDFSLNKLNLDVYITSRCNFKCSYCYKGKAYNKDISPEDALRSVEFIRGSKYQVYPCILGGEPLLNLKTLNFLIKSYSSLKNVPVVTVTSNGSREVKDVCEPCQFVFSWHWQYWDRVKDTFLRNIQYCEDHDIGYTVSIQIKDGLEIPKELLQKNLYVNPISRIKFTSKQYDQWLSLYKVNSKVLNERQVLSLGLNRFLGQKCYCRWWNFNLDGTITLGCSNTPYTKIPNFVYCKNHTCSCGIASLRNLKC